MVGDAGAPRGATRPAAVVVDGDRRYALWLFDLGLACCAVEYAAAAAGDDLDRAGVHPWSDGPRTADVLVVSGTVTEVMAPAVRRAFEQLAEPRRVVSFGACANSGGPYWDSYSVVPGVAELMPVDVFVPGCPPRPEALVAALHELVARDRVAGES